MTDSTSAHVDTFARERLPPPELQPEFLFELPELKFPPRLNCAAMLLDDAVHRGWADRPCVRTPTGPSWTYAQLRDRADRIAHVLVREMGVVAGNRVLLRAPNTPMLAAAWFGVVKAGAIAVATMPLLRASELAKVITKGQVSHALCDAALADELEAARAQCPVLREVRRFDGTDRELETAMARHDAPFTALDTAAQDIALIAFTSGTTGVPKGTMHTHRDVIAACRCWPPHVLRADENDIFIGSPPLAFTFGLGGLLLFPMSVGASVVLVDKPTPQALLDAICATGATVLFTAPTSYRALAAAAGERRVSVPLGGTLRKCVAAGEVLPAATRLLWKQAAGIEIIDGIGSTEMLHIFISADEAHARPGATGIAVPGYRATVLGADLKPVPTGEIGQLAVKGPTGCRYLDDARQTRYVQQGWNLTGDAYFMDADGYFHFCSRTDDMIVSSGYNIGAPEVEDALLTHPAVAECAVTGLPDEERGQVVAAFVVVKPGTIADDDLARALQEHVKATVAPYKYPRRVRFFGTLPRTENGKLQRFRLKDLAP